MPSCPRQASAEITQRILAHHEHIFNVNGGQDEDAIVAALPPHLQHQLQWALYHSLLRAAPFFRSCETSFLKALAAHMRTHHLLAGDRVISRGDNGNTLWFLRAGRVEVLLYRTDIDAEEKPFKRVFVPPMPPQAAAAAASANAGAALLARIAARDSASAEHSATGSAKSSPMLGAVPRVGSSGGSSNTARTPASPRLAPISEHQALPKSDATASVAASSTATAAKPSDSQQTPLVFFGDVSFFTRDNRLATVTVHSPHVELVSLPQADYVRVLNAFPHVEAPVRAAFLKHALRHYADFRAMFDRDKALRYCFGC